MYSVFIEYYVFPRILESLPPLPRQHSAAISCTKNYQSILYTRIALRALKVSYSDVGEGGGKTHFFLNTL